TPTTLSMHLAHDTGVSGDGITSDATLSGTTNAYAVVTFSENGNQLGSVLAAQDGSFSTSFALADGIHTISASVGRDTTVSASTTFTLDTTADAGGDLAISLPDRATSDILGSVPYTITGLDADILAGGSASLTIGSLTVPLTAASGTIDLSGLPTVT